jgi:hypothetical protein
MTSRSRHRYQGVTTANNSLLTTGKENLSYPKANDEEASILS